MHPENRNWGGIKKWGQCFALKISTKSEHLNQILNKEERKETGWDEIIDPNVLHWKKVINPEPISKNYKTKTGRGPGIVLCNIKNNQFILSLALAYIFFLAYIFWHHFNLFRVFDWSFQIRKKFWHIYETFHVDVNIYILKLFGTKSDHRNQVIEIRW